jgi:diacylglycerol kinase (ATP)
MVSIAMERIIRAIFYTWRGLSWTARFEAAFRQEIVVFLLAVPASQLLTPDMWQRAVLLGSVIFVMIVELLNTAIEKLCDRITTKPDEQIGRVKDIASAAVGLAILLALTVWTPAVIEALRRV